VHYLSSNLHLNLETDRESSKSKLHQLQVMN
jgi:hypothetical protein